MTFVCGNTVLHIEPGRSRLVAVTALQLTPQESKLAYVLFSNGRVISKAELMDYLYDPLDPPFDKAVDVALCRLRKKLAAIGSDVLIHSQWGLGWHLRPAQNAPENVGEFLKGDVTERGHHPLGATEGEVEGPCVGAHDQDMVDAAP